MTEGTNSPRRQAEADGPEETTSSRSGRATGNWLKFGALTWIVVIGLALVFVVAIVVAAR